MYNNENNESNENKYNYYLVDLDYHAKEYCQLAIICLLTLETFMIFIITFIYLPYF